MNRVAEEYCCLPLTWNITKSVLRFWSVVPPIPYSLEMCCLLMVGESSLSLWLHRKYLLFCPRISAKAMDERSMWFIRRSMHQYLADFNSVVTEILKTYFLTYIFLSSPNPDLARTFIERSWWQHQTRLIGVKSLPFVKENGKVQA